MPDWFLWIVAAVFGVVAVVWSVLWWAVYGPLAGVTMAGAFTFCAVFPRWLVRRYR